MQITIDKKSAPEIVKSKKSKETIKKSQSLSSKSTNKSDTLPKMKAKREASVSPVAKKKKKWEWLHVKTSRQWGSMLDRQLKEQTNKN